MNCRPADLARPFTQRNIERLPEDAFGLYSFWVNGICLYIGKAERRPLKVRLLDHFNHCHNPDLKDWFHAFSRDMLFAVKVVNDPGKIHGAERHYIGLFAPRANKTR